MKLTKKNIIQIIKQDEKEVGNKYDLNDRENIISALRSIESNIELGFTMELRSSMGGGDYWLEIEYYSNKIQKSIIYDCSTQDFFSDLEEFANYIIEKNKEVEKFEEKLIKL